MVEPPRGLCAEDGQVSFGEDLGGAVDQVGIGGGGVAQWEWQPQGVVLLRAEPVERQDLDPFYRGTEGGDEVGKPGDVGRFVGRARSPTGRSPSPTCSTTPTPSCPG